MQARVGKRRMWGLMLGGLLLASSTAGAGVSVGFDAKTLNELLPALTPDEVTVPLTESRSLRIRLEDLVITGFAPRGGGDGVDHLLTSVTVTAPQLGLSTPMEPRLSLRVVEQGSASFLELRFEEAPLPLPIAGSMNVAVFLPPLRFPADSLFLVAGTRGDVRVRSRLTSVKMGLRVVRLEFDLGVVDSP